uniref:K Homology domain-containing protein n=1 Tax=Pyrodinium bahamense TaxID=73915 RepID=A0A7S0FL80_9DINO|mmetsp:Transcript_36601/g.101611  ORF Transcript_36601/g.101611 Transcript_36601/m.101611 type:complete len:503 (+) Transcript_36601:45-1553(+)
MDLDIPTSAWGKIIGKGGETLKGLQQQFGVRIQVPKQDAPPGAKVTLRGPTSACSECAEHIRVMVAEMGRGKTKPASKKKHPTMAAWPATCQLCERQIHSISSTFDHLCGSVHFESLRERIDSAVPLDQPPGSGNIAGALALLQSTREFHASLGFDVDALTAAAPAYEQCLREKKAFQDEIARVPATFEWIRIEQRWFSAWDEHPAASGKVSRILEAPPFEELCLRCIADEMPPLIREPALPSSLPKVPKGRKEMQLKAKHVFPFEPSSRLGLAVLAKRGSALDDIDVVCGTSLIKALSGDGKRCGDTYYLQRFQGTLCCLHVPKASHPQDDAGHAVQSLFCGADSKRPRSFFASSRVRIGSRKVLITSEVDARDARGEVVEIKSSGSKTGTDMLSGSIALQVACNGSEHVLCCTLNKDKTHMLQVDKIRVADVLEKHRGSITNDGQRLSLLLERLCGHEYLACGEDGYGPMIELTFDDAKLPVYKPAPVGVTVLPAGLSCV